MKMTPAEHYAEAERILPDPADYRDRTADSFTRLTALAQVHATLASVDPAVLVAGIVGDFEDATRAPTIAELHEVRTAIAGAVPYAPVAVRHVRDRFQLDEATARKWIKAASGVGA